MVLERSKIFSEFLVAALLILFLFFSVPAVGVSI